MRKKRCNRPVPTTRPSIGRSPHCPFHWVLPWRTVYFGVVSGAGVNQPDPFLCQPTTRRVVVSAANPTIRTRQSQHGFGQRGGSFLRCEHFDRVCGASAMVGFAALTATLRVQLTCLTEVLIARGLRHEQHCRVRADISNRAKKEH